MDGFSLEQKYIETEKGKIFYFSHCPFPGRPTILLLHGLSSNHTTWKLMMRKLSEMRVNAIAPDLRGHGLSDKTRDRSLCSISQMTSDIEKIVAQENLDKVIVVGYSWGGYIAVDYALAQKEKTKGLVLVSASHVKPFAYGTLPFLAPLCRFISILLGYIFIWQKRKKYYYFVHDKILGYWASTFTGFATMPWSVNFWMLAEILNVDYRNTVQNISCPTLVICGKGDAFVSEGEVEDLSSKVKNSHIIRMENGGHYLGSWYQEEVAKHITQFIRDNYLSE